MITCLEDGTKSLHLRAKRKQYSFLVVLDPELLLRVVMPMCEEPKSQIGCAIGSDQVAMICS